MGNNYDSDRKDDLIDYYSRAFATQDLKFTMMGMLLDDDLVNQRIEEYDLKSVYIYGTGPIGVQFYKVVREKTDVRGFIDDDGEFYYNGNYSWGYRNIDMPVYSIEAIKRRYKDEKILLASFEELEDMRSKCTAFAADDRIIYINEFLFGGANSDLYR